ncbi:MAG: glycosyltransferase family 1 protein, partial [Bacteroidota bacterium]|nr:glycosyltransferase family 1 protein [Bacteroidota bacterium]
LYLHGWDIALVPFLLNESTRFISPTKTPEYLAGGKPVISTPIQDVVHPYGAKGLVHIVNNSKEFIQKAVEELAATDKQKWLAKTDEFLKDNSWDATWQQMNNLIQTELDKKTAFHHSKQIKNNTKKEDAYV